VLYVFTAFLMNPTKGMVLKVFPKKIFASFEKSYIFETALKTLPLEGHLMLLPAWNLKAPCIPVVYLLFRLYYGTIPAWPAPQCCTTSHIHRYGTDICVWNTHGWKMYNGCTANQMGNPLRCLLQNVLQNTSNGTYLNAKNSAENLQTASSESLPN